MRHINDDLATPIYFQHPMMRPITGVTGFPRGPPQMEGSGSSRTLRQHKGAAALGHARHGTHTPSTQLYQEQRGRPAPACRYPGREGRHCASTPASTVGPRVGHDALQTQGLGRSGLVLLVELLVLRCGGWAVGEQIVCGPVWSRVVLRLSSRCRTVVGWCGCVALCFASAVVHGELEMGDAVQESARRALM